MTRSAQCLIPDGPNYRRGDFLAGLVAAGYHLQDAIRSPGPGDVLVIWNRSSRNESEAQRFERAGAKVLVAENGYLGKMWRGSKWFALAVGHHAGAGWWPDGGSGRWDDWKVELAEWRYGPGDRVVFAQRGIGEPGIASPGGWAERMASAVGGRVRQHPGPNMPPVSLADDLASAEACFTWNSSAALLALMMGVPVFYAHALWIGAQAGLHVTEWPAVPKRNDGDRLAMFRRLAWAQWTADEVRAGVPFVYLKGIA